MATVVPPFTFIHINGGRSSLFNFDRQMITKGENKYTFKQYARKEVSNYLEGLFDNPSKHIPNFDDLTFNQQEQVLRHISLFEDRIKKLIGQPIDE